MRVAGFEKESYTDGTGIRYTVFVQGCLHGCHGCHNPETHDFNGGTDIDVKEIIEDIKKNPMLDGVTLSGGDPMYQTDECIKLCKYIKEVGGLDIWCYTGFTYEECLGDENRKQLLSNIDILVDGMFVEKLKSLNLLFRGSSNQRIIDVKKSLEAGKVIEAEIER